MRAGARTAKLPGMGHRVLVIDDNQAVRLILTGMLEEFGHQVVGEVAEAGGAVDAYLSLKPDLVTLDLSLSVAGGPDGTTVLDDLLRADAKARVIVVSGNAQAKLREKLAAAGAKAFVAKPIEEDELKKAIAEAAK